MTTSTEKELRGIIFDILFNLGPIKWGKHGFGKMKSPTTLNPITYQRWCKAAKFGDDAEVNEAIRRFSDED